MLQQSMEQNLSNMYCDTKNTVLVCEQMPYPVWFSWRRKSFLEYCEYSLKVDTLGTRGFLSRARRNFRRVSAEGRIHERRSREKT